LVISISTSMNFYSIVVNAPATFTTIHDYTTISFQEKQLFVFFPLTIDYNNHCITENGFIICGAINRFLPYIPSIEKIKVRSSSYICCCIKQSFKYSQKDRWKPLCCFAQQMEYGKLQLFPFIDNYRGLRSYCVFGLEYDA
jgi:hypothetical protein